MDKKLLKQAIKKAGSQAELARHLNCTRQNINNIMRGVPMGVKLAESIKAYIDG